VLSDGCDLQTTKQIGTVADGFGSLRGVKDCAVSRQWSMIHDFFDVFTGVIMRYIAEDTDEILFHR
jgi:hypothetical protein